MFEISAVTGFMNCISLRRLGRLLCFASLIGLVPLTGYTQKGKATEFSAARLVEQPRDGWRTNGGNLYNQRYSPLRQINTDNVTQLKGVWRTHLQGSGLGPKYSGEAQPIVHNGVVYIVTGADDVFALSVKTGEILWRHTANLPEVFSVCCGWTSRGVGMGDGKIFSGQLDNQVVALDQKTGQVVWSVTNRRWQDGYTITSAPLYVDGLVITGYAGADHGTRGVVDAFDAKTGRLVWSHFTIPGPGEPGHETWPDNDIWKYGGGNVWSTPAVDPALGLLYFGTGNAAPDYNGAVREGDNLYTSSIMALEIKTGKYRWHFQEVKHDIWDYDGPNPILLFDVELDGKQRKGIAHASKTGWVYILDRMTGQPLIGIEDRPVPQDARQKTAATQPFPVGDAIVPQKMEIAPEGWHLVNEGRIFTPFWAESLVLKPSIFGGMTWQPSSYDPATQRMYVCAVDQIGLYIGGLKDFDVPKDPGHGYLGGVTSQIHFPPSGIFAALDLKTNKLVWRQLWPERCYSGSIATGGDLLFVGRSDGRFTAMDSRDGKRLWEFQTGAGMNSTASTFEYEGKQYVVAYSAGNLFMSSKRGDSVWLFALDGALKPAEDEDSAHSASGSQTSMAASLPAAAADLKNGAKVFADACSACHGGQGEGGHGPSLNTSKFSLDDVVRQVKLGSGNMPALADILGERNVRDVSAFVHGQIMQH